LFYELMRVVRLVGPRYIVLENVAAITSNGLDAVLGTLAEAGFDAEWACIPAADVGACHRRDRWWCVAYANHQRLEGRISAGMRERAEQWPAWPRDSQRLSSDWRAYVSEPVLRRGDDGLPGRVDRLRALGNAVVPQVAMVPLARVLELAS
jgi:DNA (cytosine-5)-methyltransferase 1